jgi:hypothetical protein
LAEIRVDQSHCNFHLAHQLTKLGFRVIYRDAGRVSRGGPGLWGAVYSMFEQNGWPIPDIVALGSESIILFEIDGTLVQGQRNLDRFDVLRPQLLPALNACLRRHDVEVASRIALGFCRTSVSTRPKLLIERWRQQAPNIDVFAVFTAPGKPYLAFS